MSLKFLKNLNGNNTGHFEKYLSSIKSIEDLSISWYPSSGEDFRNIVILNEVFMESHLKDGKKWKQPDLFIYTDHDKLEFDNLFPDEMTEEFTQPMTEMESLLTEHADLSGWDIYYDDKTVVRIKRFEWLSDLDAMVDKSLASKGEFYSGPKKIAYMLLDIWTEEFGEFEANLIYCNTENDWFANKLITEDAKISHITKNNNDYKIGETDGSVRSLKNILTKLGTKYFICDSSDTEKYTDSTYKLNSIIEIPEEYWSNKGYAVFEVETRQDNTI